jgi:hypothetical protein
LNGHVVVRYELRPCWETIPMRMMRWRWVIS